MRTRNLALAGLPIAFAIFQFSHWLAGDRMYQGEFLDVVIYQGNTNLFVAYSMLCLRLSIQGGDKYARWIRRALLVLIGGSVLQFVERWVGIGYAGWWDLLAVTITYIIGGAAALSLESYRRYVQATRNHPGPTFRARHWWKL